MQNEVGGKEAAGSDLVLGEASCAGLVGAGLGGLV